MIKINNKELSSLLGKKNEFVLQGREFSKQIEKLEAERNKCGLQIQKLKDKIVPIVKKEVDGKLGEFEDITTVELYGSDVIINTYDVVEDFKKNYLEAKNKPEEKK